MEIKDNGMNFCGCSSASEAQKWDDGGLCGMAEEAILEDMSLSSRNDEYDDYITTIADYLSGTVNIDIPKEALVTILIDRDIEIDTPVNEVEPRLRKLCKADLFMWVCKGVSKRGAIADSDNGWSHSDGGFTMSDSARKMLLDEANAIYEEMGEATIGGTRIKIRSNGVMRARMTVCGEMMKRYNI